MSNQQQRLISWEEMAKHMQPSDCWVAVDGYVYNVTDFLVEHPAGDQILIKYSGLDATKRFQSAGHSDYAISLRNARKVGKLESLAYPEGYEDRIKNFKSEQLKKTKKILKIDQPISRELVKKHSTEEDCWIIIGSKVYDVTTYLNEHPGGISKIMQYAGMDATKGFEEASHSVEAIQKKQQFCIGTVRKQSNLTLLLVLILVAVAAGGWFMCA